MTPFIIWLKKDEIDELISAIIRSDSTEKTKEKELKIIELEELYDKLYAQNKRLIKLFRKIEPLNPIQKKATQVYGVKEKCNHYQEQFQKMKAHCSVYNNKCINNSIEHHNLGCDDCPISTSP